MGFLLGWSTIVLTTHATLFRPVSLEYLATNAEHVLVGKIVDVEMVDSRSGLNVDDPMARTGPLSPFQIRLLVEFRDDGIIKSTTNRIPPRLMLPLNSGYYFSLQGIRRGIGETKSFSSTLARDFLERASRNGNLRAREKLRELRKKE